MGLFGVFYCCCCCCLFVGCMFKPIFLIFVNIKFGTIHTWQLSVIDLLNLKVMLEDDRRSVRKLVGKQGKLHAHCSRKVIF